MDCPACAQPLVESTHEGVSLHACGGCGGMFLRHASLRAALATEQQERSDDERRSAMKTAGSPAVAPADTRAKLACPECGGEMRRSIHAYSSGVWTDACDEHGIWLDAGELQRLEAWTEASKRGAVGPVDPASTVGVATPRIAADGESATPRDRDRGFGVTDVANTLLPGAGDVLALPGAVADGVVGVARLPFAIAEFRRSAREHDARANMLLIQAEAEARRSADSAAREDDERQT